MQRNRLTDANVIGPTPPEELNPTELSSLTSALESLTGADDSDSIAAIACEESRRLGHATAALLVSASVEGWVVQEGAGTTGDLVADAVISEADLGSPAALAGSGLDCSQVARIPIVSRSESDESLILIDPDSSKLNLVRAFAAGVAACLTTQILTEDAAYEREVDATESERRWWVRELHDETLQGLLAVQMLLAAARRGSEQVMPKEAMEAIVQLRLEITNLRSLIGGLRPAIVERLGLIAALANLVKRTGELAQIDARDQVEGIEHWRGFPAEEARELEVVIYRVAQEACSNVAKHARATSLNVSLSIGPETVDLAVTDDGIGFVAVECRSGRGLLGMGERVEMVGGTLDVSSTPKSGTTVRIHLPVGQGPDTAAGR